MDQNIALEALSALTGCTVKPHPAGGFPDDGYSGGGIPAFISRFNSLTTSNDQPAVQDFGLNEFTSPNELTIENLISTIFFPDTFQPLACFLAQNSLDSDPDDFAALKKELFVNMEELFSQEYNYDFRGTEDPSKCYRGEEPYTRPWGWYRFALKVKDKYPKGNTWLGSPGWRDDSSPGEWPVSFHGTGLQGAIGITEGYYERGSRHLYGYGIYSTPNINIAEREDYAKKFTSKTDGKAYKVVMQNRINPEKLKKIQEEKDYWLIEIDRNATAEEVKKISTESIRPYGILRCNKYFPHHPVFILYTEHRVKLSMEDMQICLLL